MASKKILGYWSKKRNRSLRVLFKKCLLYTLYEEEFIFSFTDENCKEVYACLVWPMSD
jgi:hypothetical protein